MYFYIDFNFFQKKNPKKNYFFIRIAAENIRWALGLEQGKKYYVYDGHISFYFLNQFLNQFLS